MRILVADRLPERFAVAMRDQGHECVVDAGLSETALEAAVPGVDVLVVRSTKVTAPNPIYIERCRPGPTRTRLRGSMEMVASRSSLEPPALKTA